MIPFIFFLGIIALDQGVKILIRSGFMPGESLSVIPGFFKLTYVRNEGAAFSMFENNLWITLGLTSVLIVVCAVLLAKEWKKGNRLLASCYIMIIAGGVSNLYDRISAGYVTDMFSFGTFAVFNVADMAIVVGCFLAAFAVLFEERIKR